MPRAAARRTPQPVTPVQRARLEALRRLTRLLDDQFRVPGTRLRFGWDPIVGLIPGLGDAVPPIFSALVLLQARHMRIPPVAQARMLLNVVIDLLIGAVPVAGDLFDFAWKSNARNLVLLERHVEEVGPPRPGDSAFVGAVAAALIACAALPIIVLAWLLSWGAIVLLRHGRAKALRHNAGLRRVAQAFRSARQVMKSDDRAPPASRIPAQSGVASSCGSIFDPGRLQPTTCTTEHVPPPISLILNQICAFC